MKNFILTAVTLGMLTWSMPAQATPVPIAPGQTVSAFTPSTALFSGTRIATYTLGFSNAFENGSVLEYVYQDNGLLNFYYQVTNDPSSTDSLEAVSVSSYAGFATSVDYLLNGGDAPAAVKRQSAGTALTFAITIAPGTSSDFLEVLTNATTYGPGTIALIDSVAVNSGGYAPAVPEPSTWALLLSGAGLAAFALRRRLLA